MSKAPFPSRSPGGRALVVATALAAILITTAHGAQAGAVVDRIRAQKAIRCGGEPRPGLVGVSPDGRAAGLFLDVCRAIGAAVLGPEGRVLFDQFDSSKAYDAVRQSADDVMFLTASEIMQEDLAAKMLPGPPIFFATTAVMVPDDSPVRHLADLATSPICFSIGSSTQRHLEAWFAAHHLDFIRMGYQEDVELYDTYQARVCGALAAESTTLAEVRLDTGVNHITSRLLPEPLAVFPILATTPVTDPEFSAIVAWAVHSLQRADVPATPWSSGGLDALKISAPAASLTPDWQSRVVSAAGSYGDIFKRNLGEGSVYRLSPGLNAPLQAGGLFVPPYDE